MIVQAALGDKDSQDTEFNDDYFKIVCDLWTTKFPESDFQTIEQRTRVFEVVSLFFSSGLNNDLASKFVDNLQVDWKSVPLWQYKIYFSLVPVFIELCPDQSGILNKFWIYRVYS